MNDDLELDQRQLEAATSRRLPADAALDSETSALREGFIGLGRAVESAAADYDEAALVARLQASCAGEGDGVARKTNSTSVWQLALGGVLAASALVAIARIMASWPVDEAVVAVSDLPDENRVAVAAESPNPGLAEKNLSPSDAADAWDDPLDEEIVAAETSLADLTASPEGIDGALSNIHQTLEALADDLAGKSL